MNCYRGLLSHHETPIVALKERKITPEAADQLSDISMLLAEFFRLRDLLSAEQLNEILASEEFPRELNEKLSTIGWKRS